MRRPQFSLKTLLWLMACVGCFCGGWTGRYLATQKDWLAQEAELNELREFRSIFDRTGDLHVETVIHSDNRSPSAETLELRAFEGMTGRPVK